MPIPETLLATLPAEYADLIRAAAASGDYTPLQRRLDAAAENDPLMQPYTGESGTKYYKPFVQTVVPRIIESLRRGNDTSTPPEIKILHTEIDAVRAGLGIRPFESPQDVLYAFSSERYPEWGSTLDGMGFSSACMDGEGSICVTMAPRYLRPETPDMEVTELRGAIGRDFWITANALFSDFPLRRNLEIITAAVGITAQLEQIFALGPTEPAAQALRTFLVTTAQRVDLSAIHRALLQLASAKINKQLPPEKARFSSAAYARTLDGRIQRGAQLPQEQVALKYAEEGRYLRKLLDGAPLEHFQSNVKMVSNPLRGSKCEIDSIYAVNGEKRLILVEAKGKDRVSRTQLYQAYETFRLKLPADWVLTVVAILMSQPSDLDVAAGVETIIDLIEVGFDDAVFGKITASLAAIHPKKHIRWKIVGRR